MTESIITKLICGNHGALDFSEVTDIGSGMMDLKGSFEMDMQNRDVFCVTSFNWRKMVIYKTKVRLWTEVQCTQRNSLHLCKDFLLGVILRGERKFHRSQGLHKISRLDQEERL
uniref:Uncharacterized protein n=1 Tax=Paramormyrops kingsleyae TaxID=1676925 RepID=A0A3B3RDS1_9TELE